MSAKEIIQDIFDGNIVRRGHTSAMTSSGLILVGGYGSTTTLELLGTGELHSLLKLLTKFCITTR